MKTHVHLWTPNRAKVFTVPGSPSEVSDRIVRIKRALNLRLTHGVQAASTTKTT